ncbi:hypothetical protein ACLB2K_071564 [Fragaria x ananassa]
MHGYQTPSHVPEQQFRNLTENYTKTMKQSQQGGKGSRLPLRQDKRSKWSSTGQGKGILVNSQQQDLARKKKLEAEPLPIYFFSIMHQQGRASFLSSACL